MSPRITRSKSSSSCRLCGNSPAPRRSSSRSAPLPARTVCTAHRLSALEGIAHVARFPAGAIVDQQGFAPAGHGLHVKRPLVVVGAGLAGHGIDDHPHGQRQGMDRQSRFGLAELPGGQLADGKVERRPPPARARGLQFLLLIRSCRRTRLAVERSGSPACGRRSRHSPAGGHHRTPSAGRPRRRWPGPAGPPRRRRRS